MNDALTGKTSKSEHGTDWDKLQRLTPADIRAAIDDDPDAHPTDAAFWQTAKIVMPCPKSTITIRIDKDVLDWLKPIKIGTNIAFTKICLFNGNLCSL